MIEIYLILYVLVITTIYGKSDVYREVDPW